MSTFNDDDDGPFIRQGQPPGTPVRTCATPMAAGDFDWRKVMTAASPEELAEDERRIAAIKAEKAAAERVIAAKAWAEICPPRIQENDWNHAGLKPYQKHIAIIRNWQMSGQGIYAVGESGKGKSRSLWHLARRLAVDELIPMRYLVQGQILNEINRSSVDAWLSRMSGLRYVPLILWDDFGNFAAMGSRRDLLATELFGLIDHRFNHNLPMLISSNARAEDLEAIFGRVRTEPIMRRLIEGNMVVDFDKKLDFQHST